MTPSQPDLTPLAPTPSCDQGPPGPDSPAAPPNPPDRRPFWVCFVPRSWLQVTENRRVMEIAVGLFRSLAIRRQAPGRGILSTLARRSGRRGAGDAGKTRSRRRTQNSFVFRVFHRPSRVSPEPCLATGPAWTVFPTPELPNTPGAQCALQDYTTYQPKITFVRPQKWKMAAIFFACFISR